MLRWGFIRGNTCVSENREPRETGEPSDYGKSLTSSDREREKGLVESVLNWHAF